MGHDSTIDESNQLMFLFLRIYSVSKWDCLLLDELRYTRYQVDIYFTFCFISINTIIIIRGYVFLCIFLLHILDETHLHLAGKHNLTKKTIYHDISCRLPMINIRVFLFSQQDRHEVLLFQSLGSEVFLVVLQFYSTLKFIYSFLLEQSCDMTF